jgi:hypothetical protein
MLEINQYDKLIGFLVVDYGKEKSFFLKLNPISTWVQNFYKNLLYLLCFKAKTSPEKPRNTRKRIEKVFILAMKLKLVHE